jgi:tRNA(fMet)-specific endonuclease VapC
MALYCLDTNVISAVMDNDETVLLKWVSAKRAGHSLSMSAMTYYEVKRGLELPLRARKYAAFEGILRQTQILMTDVATYDVAALIYQQLKPIGKLIEMAYGAVLVTRNTEHMNRIQGLTF